MWAESGKRGDRPKPAAAPAHEGHCRNRRIREANRFVRGVDLPRAHIRWRVEMVLRGVHNERTQVRSLN
jgi:hypothetical protein